MPALTDPTGLMLAHRNEYLRAGLTMGPPSLEMIADYQDQNILVRDITHKTNRGKYETALELGMSIKEFEAFCLGKSILDIGCGEGVLSYDLAQLPGCRVTALDHDPVMIDRVRTGPNLVAVEGSGNALPAGIRDERFDIVISSFSSVLWADGPKDKRAAINSALQSCDSGGNVLLIPVISNPTHRAMLKNSIINGSSQLSTADKLYALNCLYTSDWMDVQTFDGLTDLENVGLVATSYAPSFENNRGVPTQERYSATINVLGDISALLA